MYIILQLSEMICVQCLNLNVDKLKKKSINNSIYFMRWNHLIVSNTQSFTECKKALNASTIHVRQVS